MDDTGPKPKRQKLDSKAMHTYAAIPTCAEDEESYKRNLQVNCAMVKLVMLCVFCRFALCV